MLIGGSIHGLLQECCKGFQTSGVEMHAVAAVRLTEAVSVGAGVHALRVIPNRGLSAANRAKCPLPVLCTPYTIRTDLDSLACLPKEAFDGI